MSGKKLGSGSVWLDRSVRFRLGSDFRSQVRIDLVPVSDLGLRSGSVWVSVNGSQSYNSPKVVTSPEIFWSQEKIFPNRSENIIFMIPIRKFFWSQEKIFPNRSENIIFMIPIHKIFRYQENFSQPIIIVNNYDLIPNFCVKKFFPPIVTIIIYGPSRKFSGLRKIFPTYRKTIYLWSPSRKFSGLRKIFLTQTHYFFLSLQKNFLVSQENFKKNRKSHRWPFPFTAFTFFFPI
jgi:hypothetical protein